MLLTVNRVFECPLERTDAGPAAILPTETTRLPREKPMPEPKPETKWEKFAKDKGILKKKRERMIFDDDAQQWAPRFGYKRAKRSGGEDEAMPVMEVKSGTDPFADPWSLARENKKQRVEKNKMQQQKNIEKSAAKKNGYKLNSNSEGKRNECNIINERKSSG